MSTYNINRHLALTSRWSPHSRYSLTARSVLVACEESQAEHCKDSQDAYDGGSMSEPYYSVEFAIQKLQDA